MRFCAREHVFAQSQSNGSTAPKHDESFLVVVSSGQEQPFFPQQLSFREVTFCKKLLYLGCHVFQTASNDGSEVSFVQGSESE